MQTDETTGRNAREVDAVWIDAPRITIFRSRFSEVAHGSFAVVVSSPHRPDECIRNIPEIVDSQTVRNGTNDVAHFGQILTERQHIRIVVLAPNEKTSVGYDDERTHGIRIAFRFVNVHD